MSESRPGSVGDGAVPPPPPRTKRVWVWRCPKCGSTKAGPDESRSAYDLTYMTCLACGEGGLCDSWERDADWSLEIEIAADANEAPDQVAPLPTGEGLYESLARIRESKAAAVPTPTAPTTPTQAFGCQECCGPDAEVAWAASRARHVQRLIDESHYDISLKACECGQHFAMVFTERINWQGDGDDMTSLVVPIRPDEVVQLQRCPESDLRRVLTTLATGRRFLLHVSPSGPSPTQWRDGGFAIGPHD